MSWLRLIEQSMKVKTSGAAAGADEVRGKPAPKARTRDRFRHLLGEMWPAYLIEIVVIILGISISLALEEWRDGAKEDKLERIYRGNLLADIDADLVALHYASANTTALLAHGEHILQSEKGSAAPSLSSAASPRSSAAGSPSDTALTADLRSIIGRPKFIPRDATFADLKSSGNLHLIKDVSLKGLLFAYYNQVQLIKENQESEQQATITLVGPYFLQRFPMDDVLENASPHEKGETHIAVADDIEFRNLVLLRVGNRTELLALYQTADSLAARLKEALQTK
jgi:hypothetical protein